MIIDMHTHLMGPAYKSQPEILLKAMDRYGIDKIYVSGLSSMNGNPTKELIRIYNDAVYDFKRAEPDKVEAYVYASPELPGAIDEIKYGIEDNGAIGLKVWMSTFADDKAMDKVAETMIGYNMPILFHAFYKAHDQLLYETLGNHIANIARRYPELKVIMAHLGGSAYHAIPAIRAVPNVWVDMCSSIFRGDELQYTIEQIGVDRILFGSDMPGNYIVNVGQVEELDLTQEEKDKIYYKNTLHVFDTKTYAEGGRK